MKYINNHRKIYINDHNIPIAVKKPLTKEQMEKLDVAFGIGEILRIKEYENFKDFVDYNDTRYINLTRFISNKSNTINIPLYNEIKPMLKKQFDSDEYGFWYCNMNEIIKNSIPERFENLDVNLSYFFDNIAIDFKTHSASRFDKTIRRGGMYYSTINKIDFKYPIFVFNAEEMDKNKEYNTNFLSSFYAEFVNDSLCFLIHELKHAFNEHTASNLLRYKKISLYDRLKLIKYEEYSAEMEAIFNLINKKKAVENYINFPSSLRYKNILNYVDTHKNYYENLPEFINFVKQEVEEKFLKTFSDTYNEEYYLKDVALQIAQFPNNFANKSDENVYKTLKKSSLTFEIFNPKTRKTELVDLSSYFKDEELSSKEKYVLDKQFREAKNLTKDLKKITNISNKTLKYLECELIR